MKEGHTKKLSFLIVALMALGACNDLVKIAPPETEIVRSQVFADQNTALAALAGVYNKLRNSTGFDGRHSSFVIAQGAYADELTSFASQGNPVVPFYVNTITPANPSMSSLWSGSYSIIYSANAAIEGLTASKIADSFKNQLIGEALFIRAFVHFYMVNAFGAVPYISTTDYEANAKVTRAPVSEVYENIKRDLLHAKELMGTSYPAPNRIRVNRAVASALLARVYLYNNEWVKAETEASEVINASPMDIKLEADLSKAFLKESRETLWQLDPTYGYTNEGSIFILTAPPTIVALRDDLVGLFEDNDLRKKHWTDSIMSSSGTTKWFFPYKYKVRNINNDQEYSVLFRLAEQYLIRAEARLNLNKLLGGNSALSDINIIRDRAGLSNTPATSLEDIQRAIEQERRVELFTEWGHRFFDLKRWNKLDAVLGAVKPNWDHKDALLPLPQAEILANPRLIQNEGY